MRIIITALLIAFATPAPAAAQAEPTASRIIQMALLRMVEQVDFLGNASFGPSDIHPQPEGRYWAVVGQIVSGAQTGHMQHYVYVAAVRLICADAGDDTCWRLEKLAIDNRIVYDRANEL